MRKTDHQLQQAAVHLRVAQGRRQAPVLVENTGYNFQTVKAIPEYVASTPTSCEMKRP